jgi:hypothetical protein
LLCYVSGRQNVMVVGGIITPQGSLLVAFVV